MTWTVKILVAGNPPPGNTEEGDIICVVPSTHDWGQKTVEPSWIRSEITNVDAPNQEAAEQYGRENWTVKWDTGFNTNSVTLGRVQSAGRYECLAVDALKGELDQTARIEVRDRVLADHKGTLVSEDADGFVFDASPNIPLDEIKESMKAVRFRRIKFEMQQLAKVGEKRMGSREQLETVAARDKLRRRV